MGLDTTHDCWHGPYGAFMRWREAVAKAAGLPPLMLMEGFWTNPASSGGDRLSGTALSVRVAADTLDRLSDRVSPPHTGEDRSLRPGASLLRCLSFDPIRWSALKPDPLHILLHHSDCEGEITAADCGPIADSLERVLPDMPDDTSVRGAEWFRDKTRTFIAGLRQASAAGENVRFH